MRQGADDPELREEGDATGSLELRGRTSQMRADPRERDLRGVRLEDHQVPLQLLERQAALLVETSGGDKGMYTFSVEYITRMKVEKDIRVSCLSAIPTWRPTALRGLTFMPEPRVSRSPKSRPSLHAYRHSTTL
ncbi:hypothetical protein EYF80_035238 [Liparis tanakae]|uniref:Uncharacterized protein n=1 Tax=Liparis tanakae TaxID=230148 RepID=A0A4Z2GMU7_9TELE|nr:hypothetical protein EYF80_035238 [Liparis tanakae]